MSPTDDELAARNDQGAGKPRKFREENNVLVLVSTPACSAVTVFKCSLLFVYCMNSLHVLLCPIICFLPYIRRLTTT